MEKYIAYADGTFFKYRALYLRHNAPPKYSKEVDAEEFTENELVSLGFRKSSNDGIYRRVSTKYIWTAEEIKQ